MSIPLGHACDILNYHQNSTPRHGHNIYMCNHGNSSLLLGMN